MIKAGKIDPQMQKKYEADTSGVEPIFKDQIQGRSNGRDGETQGRSGETQGRSG